VNCPSFAAKTVTVSGDQGDATVTMTVTTTAMNRTVVCASSFTYFVAFLLKNNTAVYCRQINATYTTVDDIISFYCAQKYFKIIKHLKHIFCCHLP